MSQLAIKDIEYKFNENSSIFTEIQAKAIETVKNIYEDEKEFQKEEFEDLLESQEVVDYEDYKENVLDFNSNDIDYSMNFEENIDHFQIQAQIKETTERYLSNFLDLPKMQVVSIDDNLADDLKQKAIKDLILEKLNVSEDIVTIKSFKNADKEADKGELLTQKAYEKIGEMIETKDYQTYLELRATIGKYSSNNISMIYAQKNDAKVVNGFNSWKKLDRVVAKGTKGIAIWQPCKKELKTEEAIDKHFEDKINYNLSKTTPNDYSVKKDKLVSIYAKEKKNLLKTLQEKGKAEIFQGYKLGYIFDISQTIPLNPEHDNLEEIINLNKPLDKEFENFDVISNCIENAGTLLSISVPNTDNKQEDLFNAIYNYADNVFSKMPEKIDGIKSNEVKKGDMHLVETIMSTYIICSHIGIDCGDKANLKLAKVFDDNKSIDVLEMGKRGMFAQGFDRAVKLSDQFIKTFDKAFEVDKGIQKETDDKKKQKNNDFQKE